MTEADPQTLRARIEQLCTRHAQGDLPERPFRRALARCTADLGRAVVQERLAEGETILHEHHVVRALTELAESLLKEPDREVTSLYATDRRLLRLRSTLSAGQPLTCDARDKTVMDDLWFEQIEGLHIHRHIRRSEIWTGLVIAAFAFFFHSWLKMTGYLMIMLGGLGVLHGLLLPTSWVEVKTRTSIANPMLIHAVRKKSGRRLVQLLRRNAQINSHPCMARA